MSKRGRKSVYDVIIEPRLDDIEWWLTQGATEKEVYDKLGISHESFYKYKKEKSEFAEVLKRGKEPADMEVERALHKRALGYFYDEITTETIEGENGIITKEKKITKHIAPDVSAQIYWLSNRKNNTWKRNPDLNNNSKHDETVDVEFVEVKGHEDE